MLLTESDIVRGVGASGVARRAEPMACTCDHCGLPVPAGLVEAGAERQFCCGACRTAYRVIHAAGLDRYYAIRDAAASASRTRAGSSERTYAEFDDPDFLGLYASERPDGVRQIDLRVENLHCAACLWLLERLPEVVPGVRESRVAFGASQLTIAWEPAATALSAVGRFVDDLGYPVHPIRGRALDDTRRAEDRAALIRIGVAGALAGNTMLVALALYAGLVSGMEPQFQLLFRGVSMVLAVCSLAWPGRVFFRGAWAAVRTRTLNMDVPIALGLGVGGLWGTWNVVRQSGEVYFDTITTLVFLLLLGRWVQTRQQRKAADAVELLHALTPPSATVLCADGSERTVPVATIAVGQTVRVPAGGVVPTDGVISRGASAIDESMLTGESRPVRVEEGRRVFAGTTNLQSPLDVVVSASGVETRAAKIMRLVEDAAANRAPIVRLADRIAARFVAAVLALAAVTVAIWLRLDPAHAVDHAASLLIVTCPCALALATPLAVSAAIGRAARRGILVKGGDPLESLARPGTIYLDKTGTITEGRMDVVRWIGDHRVRSDVAAIEREGVHPIATALRVAPGNAPLPVATAVRAIPGAGMMGIVDGRTIIACSLDHAQRVAEAIPADLEAGIRRALDDALTPVVVCEDGRVVAVACIGDPIRGDAAEAIAALRSRGWEVRMLSGDHPRVVRAVAEAVGIAPEHAAGGASPEEKLRVIREAAERGRVVMVGDGVNDAAALAAATVGIAVHGGAEASLAAADVFVSTPGLSPLVMLTEGARRTIGVIRRNAGASLGYNLVCIGLAMTGLISPLVAAILMPISSLTVVMISARSRIFPDTPAS